MVLYVVHHYSYSNGHSHVGRGQHCPDGPWAQGPRDISDGLRPTKGPGAVPGISTAQPGRSHSATVSGVIASIKKPLRIYPLVS